MYDYTCCLGKSEDMCSTWTPTWTPSLTPGVCYHVTNYILTGAIPEWFSGPLFACEVHSARVHGLLIGMVFLATARILLQVVWYRRFNAKLDFGKKGLNLWLIVIPLVATGAIFYYYLSECVEHMGIYSLQTVASLLDGIPHPIPGTVFFSCYNLTLFCCASL